MQTWLFSRENRNNAAVHCIKAKFENNFGNKIHVHVLATETKTSVGKHADRTSSLRYNKAND